VSTAPGLRYGLYALVFVYAALTVATVYVLRRLARAPLEVPSGSPAANAPEEPPGATG